MDDTFRFSETYLFKVHLLQASLDKAFDLTLRRHADITLSLFTLLLAAAEQRLSNQRSLARFLDISPAAVNRQVEIAKQRGLMAVNQREKGRGQALELTPGGEEAVRSGIQALDRHLFKIFADEDRQTNLMGHIDLLINNTKGVIVEQTVKRSPRVNLRKENIVSNQIPKAGELFRGDINEAVIKVQKLTGIEIAPAWWDQHVGNNGSTESILDRFDKAYAEEVARRKK